MQRLSKFLLIIVLLLFISLIEALAQWRFNQRQHSLANLNALELKRLANLTDASSIRALLKPILVERQVGTPQHDAVANYLKQKAEEFGFQTEWDSFEAQTPMGRKTFHNVIATFDPLVHRQLVLGSGVSATRPYATHSSFFHSDFRSFFCWNFFYHPPNHCTTDKMAKVFDFTTACHYDSKIIPGKVFLGATDSALPCALLLDIAKTLGRLMPRRENKHISLKLLFLDGEEAFHEWTESDSIYGARHLADSLERKWYPSSDGSAFELSREIDRIDVIVLLDLLGAKNPKIQGTYGHGTTPLFENLPIIEDNLSRLGLLNKIPKIFYSGTSFSAVEDDHIPFLRRGIPIMHLISVPFPDVWHTPRDNELALDDKTIENLASVIRVFVARYLGIHPVTR